MAVVRVKDQFDVEGRPVVTAKQRRKHRRETMLLQSESRWLQRALFAFNKVAEAREKLADTRGDEPAPIQDEVDGATVSLEDVRTMIQQRVDHLMEMIPRRRRKVP